eukprot:EG_transcript_11151
MPGWGSAAPLCPRPAVRLRRAAVVPTRGNAGFEHFVLDGRHLLAAANFRGNSVLFEVDLLDRVTGELSVTPVQELATKAAHGWDYLVVGEGTGRRPTLVVPNYYGCGGRKTLDSSGACKSVAIWQWDRATGNFTLAHRLYASGPSQTDHFEAHGETYLVVAENFNRSVSVFRFTGDGTAGLEKVQTLVVPGSGCAVMGHRRSGEWFLATASYIFKRRPSLIFRWEENERQFRPFQEIEACAPHDVAFGEVAGELALLLAEDRNATTPRITSQVFLFDPRRRQFAPLQTLPTDGAHGARVFTDRMGQAWLAVANFGDRLGKRYAANSSLWRYAAADGRFRKAADVPTQGATDWEHFRINGLDFVAVSNEGDLSHNLHQQSVIYYLDLRCGGAVDPWARPSSGSVAVLLFGTAALAYVLTKRWRRGWTPSVDGKRL